MKYYIRQIRPYYTFAWDGYEQYITIKGYDKWYPEDKEAKLTKELADGGLLEFEERYVNAEIYPTYFNETVWKDECDVIDLYEIVPEDDGSRYMCYDDEADFYFREHKAYTSEKSLAFDTSEAAQAYIDKYMSHSRVHYKPEIFGYSVSKAPFRIRTIEEI